MTDPDPIAAKQKRHATAMTPAESMNELFENLPGHVRVAQRRGATTGIVGFTQAKDLRSPKISK
jgi:hypothetical protein